MADDDLLHQWVMQHRRLQNYLAAIRELNLTPQEQYAYRHHLNNLARGGVRHDNGKISTFLGSSRDFDGRTYMLPNVWDNQIVDDDEAIRRAQEVGLDKWPSYGSVDEAENRYKAIHNYFDRDMQHANPPNVPVRTMLLPDGSRDGSQPVGRTGP